jgi:hypothetical protein
MTEDNAFRGLLTSLPSYLQLDRYTRTVTARSCTRSPTAGRRAAAVVPAGFLPGLTFFGFLLLTAKLTALAGAPLCGFLFALAFLAFGVLAWWSTPSNAGGTSLWVPVVLRTLVGLPVRRRSWPSMIGRWR